MHRLYNDNNNNGNNNEKLKYLYTYVDVCYHGKGQSLDTLKQPHSVFYTCQPPATQFKPRLEHIILMSLSCPLSAHKPSPHADIFMHSTYSKSLSCNSCSYIIKLAWRLCSWMNTSVLFFLPSRFLSSAALWMMPPLTPEQLSVICEIRLHFSDSEWSCVLRLVDTHMQKEHTNIASYIQPNCH